MKKKPTHDGAGIPFDQSGGPQSINDLDPKGRAMVKRLAKERDITPAQMFTLMREQGARAIPDDEPLTPPQRKRLINLSLKANRFTWIAALFGSDDRDHFLIAANRPTIDATIKLPPPKNKSIEIEARFYGWKITGLEEFNFDDEFAAFAHLTLRLDTKHKSIKLFDILRTAARFHKAFFPNGNHRYFETVTIHPEKFEIEIGCGS